MSKTIDERVVSMQFDNKQFERNVSTSMSTLEKLKRSLNLTGAAKGLDSVNAAAKSCNLSPLANSIDAVKLKFSAMQVFAISALHDIYNTAKYYSKRLVSMFTIDPVKSGFQEYETQINAVQTILANTESKGTTLADVNKALDTLNAYADKTIYNFTEMARNIGTFTAAGIDLDTSVNAIQGIANLAAVSGSNAQQASTAMYQLSQALASGTVKLMDWNSVVNAGMGGQVFQDALKETARVHGIAIDDMIKKEGSFRETLQNGWLTSEILTETLQKFTLTTEGLTKEQIEANRQMLKSKGYTDEQIESIFKLGETATNAATKVKTFTQLMDTLKEAAQSGWTQTWEYIIGDFEGAKTLWTSVSDTLGELIGRSADSRNKLVKGAMFSNWDKLVEKINDAGIETSTFEERTKSVLEKHGYVVEDVIKKHGSLEEAFRSGALSSDLLMEAIDGLSGSMVDLSSVQKDLKKGDTGEDVKKIQQRLKDLGYDLGKWDVDGIIGSKTEEAIKKFQELNGLEVTGIVDEATLKALEGTVDGVNELRESVKGLVDDITKRGGRELLISAFKNIWEAIQRIIGPIKRAWREIFPKTTSEQLYNLIEGFEKFTSKLKLNSTQMINLKRTFKGLFAILDVVKTLVGGGITGAFRLLSKILGAFDLNILDVTASIGDALVKFRDWIFDGERLNQIFSVIAKGISIAYNAIRDWISAFIKLPKVQSAITKFRNAFTKAFGGAIDKIKEFINLIKNFGKSIELADGTFKKISFKDIGEFFKNDVLGAFKKIDIGEVFNNIVKSLRGFKDGVKENLGEAGIKFDEIKGKISDFIDTVKEKIGDHKGAIVAFGFLLGLILILSKIKKMLSVIANPLESFGGIGESISTFINSFTAVNSAKAKKIKSEAIYNIAKSITLLAGALWLISKIEDPWKAVGVMGALAAGLLAFMALTQLISKINKGDSGKAMLMFGSMMRNLGIALILMAAAVKILGGMDSGEMWQGVKAVGIFLGAIATLMLFSKAIGENNIVQFGKMMRKLSTSLLFLAAAVYIFGKMETKTLVQGGTAVIGFLVIMGIMMRMTSGISKDSNAFGKMIRNISFSLLLLAGAVAIFGKMETKTLIKGGAAVITFLGIMIIAMKYTKSISGDVASFGRMMLSIGASLLLMALAIKILGKMDTRDLVKGGIVVAGFALIVTGLMKATNLLGRHSYNASKMGLMLLAFSGSILLITASIAALSLIDGKDIMKALGAIAGISLIFAEMLAMTKYAKSIETGTIIALSVAIGILAASMVALSFIDEKDLRNVTIALGAIIGMFSLLTYVSKFSSIKTTIAMAGLMLIVTGIAFIMSELIKNTDDADKAIKVAKAFSILIGTLAASCAMLSLASKFGPKSKKGFGALLLMVGIVGALAGIAIWQLPNIGKQLSKFMEELKPFLEIANTIKPGIGKQLKYLGEAMLSFTAAGALYSVFNIGGGMAKAFTSFGTFIKEVLPIIKDLALELSGEGVSINTDNLNAVIGAVSSLAEAASKGPAWRATAGGFGGKGIGGGFLSISVPMLSEFTEWIKAVITPMKELALAVSGEDVEINGEAIASICEGVSVLAEAASKGPSLTVTAGGGGGNGFGGGFVSVSIPQLAKFKSWLEGVIPVMTTFAVSISESKIKASDTDNLISICEGVKALAEAADTAPTEDYLVGGGLGVGFGGFFVGISKTDLEKFKTWIEGVIPIMTTLTTTISESKIKASDTDNLISICEGVKALAAAAGTAPKIEGAIGAVGGYGFGGFFAGISIPQLSDFTTWLAGVIPIMTGFTVSISESKIKSSDTDNLVSICEGVKALGKAAGTAPTEDYIVGGGLGVGFGGVFAGISVSQLEEFTTWLEKVIPVMTTFATTISESKIKASDTENLVSICEGVKVLAKAADNAPGLEAGGGLAAVGPVIAAGGYIKSTDLSAFKDWIVEVAPVMASFSVDISKAEITQDDAANIKSICEAVKILAEAAKSGSTTKEGIAGISLLGVYSSIKTTDIEGFRDFLTGGEDGEGVVSVMNDLATNIGTLEFDSSDCEKINQLCRAIRTLGEAASLAPTKEEIDGWFSDKTVETDLSGFKTWIEEIIDTLNGIGEDLASSEVQIDTSKLVALSNSAKLLSEGIYAFSSALNVQIFDPESFKGAAVGVAEAMVDFSKKVADINHTALSSAAGAARDIAETFSIATSYGDDYSSVDTVAFKSKAIELGEAIKEFTSNMEGVDVTSPVSQVNALSSAIGSLASGDFSGANELVKAIELLGKASIDDLVTALSDTDKLSSAGSTIVSSLATGITDNAGNITAAFSDALATAAGGIADSADSFSGAGENLVSSFASGISKNGKSVLTAFSIIVKLASFAIKSYRSEFTTAGFNLGIGFANGIKSSEFMAKLRAKALAKAALNAAKGALNEHSPSKEAYKVGSFFGKGFTNGIDAYAKNAVNSGREIAESAKTGLSNAISKVGALVENGIDSQPTIRPVLDLSDVESGAGTINGMFGMTPSIKTLSNVGTISSMMNRSQNGANDDVISAIESLGKRIGNISGDTYQINGVTYDDGSNVTDAVRTIVRAARIERRR